MSIVPGDYTGTGVPDLKTIELKEQTSSSKRLCRVGVAVTNEDFRRWAVANNAWSLPVDVILVEVTIGGVNGPICHGGGRRHLTVSDYVRRVEYVDVNGVVQAVDDPKHLHAAAGAFGLLGVVTHLTFELDSMTYAVMEPRKVDVGLAVPPLKKEDIPTVLRADWFDKKDAEQKMEAARQDFVRRAKDDYYSEWFWFTYQQKAWINTWNTVEETEGAVDYPDDAGTFLQWVEGWIGGVLTERWVVLLQWRRSAVCTGILTLIAALFSTLFQGLGRLSCSQRWAWQLCPLGLEKMTRQPSSKHSLSGTHLLQNYRKRWLMFPQDSTPERPPLPPRYPEHARTRPRASDPHPGLALRSVAARLLRRPARMVGRHQLGLRAGIHRRLGKAPP